MPALFISDLHLCEARPAIAALFFDFLQSRVRNRVEDLYILGDLFEYWIGDEDLEIPFNRDVAAAIRGVAGAGTRVHLMHGNRDFLLGADFCRVSGATLLADPALVDLFGKPTLLMHGDTLCTDDHAYLEFRAMVRDAGWQQAFLAQPAEARRRQAENARGRSETEKQSKSAEIMDVNPAAVDGVLRHHGYPRLIHGHTHRAARHLHVVDGRSCERWVLQDWYQSGGYLECTPAGCMAHPIEPG
jgi:UDP-2,3-diacylglucosamine hydrolase